mgnify:CR=1 FL=1
MGAKMMGIYDGLDKVFGKLADKCAGCKYRLELLPKLEAGQTTREDMKKFYRLCEKSDVLCHRCHADLSNYRASDAGYRVMLETGQIELENMRRQISAATKRAKKVWDTHVASTK